MLNTLESLPYEEQVRELVQEHLELKDDPLLLALQYQPEDDTENVFLLEVIEGFGGNAVDPEKDLFQVSFGAASGFPIKQEQRLYMTLTNPQEIKVAFQENWPLIQRIRDAVKSGHGRFLFKDADRGTELESLIKQ